MRVAILCVAGCSTVPAPLSNVAPSTGIAAIDVPLTPSRWAIRGNEPGQPFAFRYCCRGGGVAETSIELAAGRYLVGVTHTSSECQKALHPVIVPARAEGVLLTDAPAWGAITLARLAVPAEYAGEPLRLRLYVEGGLHCCGTTVVDKIEIVPL